MDQPRRELADLLRPRLVPPGFNDRAFLDRFDAILDAGGMRRDAERAGDEADVPATGLTVRMALELVCHESIVLEAYKDSKGIWTWGIGVTAASGHEVLRYKDNPQPMARVLEVYAWLLRERYLPAVLKAFDGFPLTEAQLAAALSFHYNTGAIGRAGWVALVREGKNAAARAAFMEWRKPPEIVERRSRECALFFDGKWSQDGKVTVFPVRKPSYTADWGRARRVDITADMAAALGAAA
jgi:lysozyme